MEPDSQILQVSDVVISRAGRDSGSLYYVKEVCPPFVLLVNGTNRPLEKPKKKKIRHIESVLHPETRVAAKLLAGDKVLNSELRKDLARLGQELQSHTLGGLQLGKRRRNRD